MKYEFMETNTDYPVVKWANILEVERSGYYAWLKKRKSLQESIEKLKTAMRKIFEDSGGTYGPDRIIVEMRKLGHKIGRARTCSYMEELGLSSCHNRH
jgi:putative transposase